MLRQRAKQFGIILGLWTATGVFDTWEVYLFNLPALQPLPVHVAVRRALPDFWICGALTPALLWFNSRFRFEREEWTRCVGVHLVMAVTLLAAWTAVKVGLYPVEDLLTSYASRRSWGWFRRLLIDNAHDAIWFYCPIVDIGELLHYQRTFRDRAALSEDPQYFLHRTRAVDPGAWAGAACWRQP